MFIPTFQGLTPNDFVRAAGSGRSRFPFDVPHLSFYRARNAIYYLFRALKSTNDTLTVLVPDYNSGNEVLALEAAGATVRYYAVGPDGQADPAEVERLCAAHHPDVLYVIHYLGWPQPVQQFAALCRPRGRRHGRGARVGRRYRLQSGRGRPRNVGAVDAAVEAARFRAHSLAAHRQLPSARCGARRPGQCVAQRSARRRLPAVFSD